MRETKRKLLELLIDAKRDGQAHRRLRRARQGQHAAQLLRHPHRLPRLHRRPQPVQAGQVPARARTSRSSRPSSIDETQARLHLHPAVELQGRDHRPSSPTSASWGGEVHRPDPRGRRSSRDAAPRSLGAAGRAAAHPVPRRAQRRHRDRLRRHAAAAARRAPGLDGALGRCFSATPEREREARASAAEFLAGGGERDGRRQAVPRRATSRTRAPRSRTSSRRSRRTVEPDLVLTHHRHDRHQDHRLDRRADLEHVPRSPDRSSTRSPSTRAISASPTSSCRSPRRRRAGRSTLLLRALPLAGRQALVPRRDLRGGACALRGIECNAPRGLRRGVSRPQASSDRQRNGRDNEGSASMKVLVTGHRGYIGVEMVPLLRAAGHEVVGLDTGFYDECDFARAARRGARRSTSTCATSRPAHLPGLRRRHPPGARCRTIRSATSTRTSPTTSTCTRRCASPRAAKEAACGASCSRRRAACTAPAATGILDENAAFNPVTAYGESKVRVEQEVVKLADASLLAGLPAQRHRVRRVAPAARRHRGQQPGRPRGDDRQGAAAERRHAVAAARPHRRHHPRLPGRA